MDPNQCYDAFLDSLEDGDPETASHRLEELATWISRGGFVPRKLAVQMTSTPELARLLVSATTVLAWAAHDLQAEKGETT